MILPEGITRDLGFCQIDFFYIVSRFLNAVLSLFNFFLFGSDLWLILVVVWIVEYVDHAAKALLLLLLDRKLLSLCLSISVRDQ